MGLRPMPLHVEKVSHSYGTVEALRDIEEAEKRASNEELRAQAADFAGFVKPLADLAGRFEVAESPHFSVHFVEGTDRVLVRRAIDTLEACQGMMPADLGGNPAGAGKVRVEIFPDPDSFEKASTLTKREIETSGTIALCKFNSLMMMTPRVVLRGFSWCDTLCHEYTHYVLWKRNGATIPIWLHEAIAKHEEPRWSGKPGSDLTPLMREVLKGAVESGKFVTFDEMHPSFAKLKNPHDVALASAEVLSVLRSVMRRGGYARVGKMLDALKDGASWRVMFEKALDQPFEEFWQAWVEETRAELKDVKGPEAPEKLVELREAAKRDPTAKPDPAKAPDGKDAEPPAEGEAKAAADEAEEDGPGDRFARLGDLLRGRSHWQAAAEEYEKAAATDKGRSPVLLNRLGLVYREAQDLASAEKAFKRSEVLDPEYAPTLTDLGLLYRSRGDAAKAVEYLEAAARINPFDPRIHEGLAEVYGALGKEASRAQAMVELDIVRGNSGRQRKGP